MRKDYIKPLYILIGALFIALFVQGYFIYNLQRATSIKKDSDSHIDIYKSEDNPAYITNSVDPFVEIQKIQENMMRNFGSFNSMFANDPFFQNAFSNSSFSAMSDIVEKDKEYMVEIKIPGVDKQKIDINTNGNMISVSTESQNSNDRDSGNYIHKESFGQYFKRSFSMPLDANLENIKSTYQDGILKIIIQKK